MVHLITSRHSGSSMKDAGRLEEVASEKRSFLESLGVRVEQLVFMEQIHSAQVRLLQEISPSHPAWMEGCDGVITSGRGQFPVIRTADCLPILIICPEQKRVCALHAGWRGTRDRIAARALKLFLKASGARPDQLIAALGPGIRVCCYQVGPEVRRQYREAGQAVDRFFTKGHLDLVAANREHLREQGVTRILDAGLCTCCRTDLFYSYRREGETGRLWTVAGFPSSTAPASRLS